MEHLMSPEERRVRKAEIDAIPSIIWLGFDHDQGYHPLTTIEGYPLRRGWTNDDLEELKLGNLKRRSGPEVLAMIQSWMFLGLLESAFEERFRIADYVDFDTRGRRIVNTANLRIWIDSYHGKYKTRATLGYMERRRQQNKLKESLEYANFWNQMVVEMEKERPSALTRSELFGPVTRLITLVAEAVLAVAQQFPSPDERFFVGCEWQLTAVNDRALKQRWRLRGWCPSMYDKIKNVSQVPTSFLEYASLVPPSEEAANQHRGCSEQCVAYNVDEKTYQPQHRPESNRSTAQCHCEMIRPPIGNVNKALRSGTIPIVNGSTLLNFETGAAVENYLPSTRAVEFVAFSHVWSDGVGSNTEAGLPRCQVQYLMETALQAAGTTLFWIDSLCIPELRETRKLAISQMSATYAGASATVVLDSGIKLCDFKQSLETKLLALSLSKWQERLWTLQESSLSKGLLFKFKDDLVFADTIMKEYNAQLHRPVIRNMGILLDNLSDWNRADQISVGGVQRNLYRRTSSKPEDESLAVAPFFPRVHIASLLDTEGEDRMIRFWEQVKFVPRAIVSMGVQKIACDGYGWAPRSLMNQRGAVRLDLRDTGATVTDMGLKALYWVCELQMPHPATTDGNGLYLLGSDSSCVLRLLETEDYPSITLSPTDHVVAFFDQPDATADNYAGVLLSKVSHGRFKHTDEQPIYKYEATIGANVWSQAMFGSQGSEGVWDQLKRLARGHYTGKWAEIYIR